MRRGTDRLDAVVSSVVGLVLAGAGGYGLARSLGAFGRAAASEPVLGEPVRTWAARNADWFWPLAAALALAVAWLALRWLMAQLRTSAVGDLRVRDEADGATEVDASTVAAAVAADVEGYPGVRRARARLVGGGGAPAVELAVEVGDGADLADVRRRIDDHALARLGQALDATDIAGRVHLRLGEPPRR